MRTLLGLVPDAKPAVDLLEVVAKLIELGFEFVEPLVDLAVPLDPSFKGPEVKFTRVGHAAPPEARRDKNS